MKEVLEVIKFIKGGKAISTDCIPDTFISYKTLRKALIEDSKIIKMVDAMERDHGFLDTRISYLQNRIAKNLTALYNYWLEDGGMPHPHVTAKNFFIYKNMAGS